MVFMGWGFTSGGKEGLCLVQLCVKYSLVPRPCAFVACSTKFCANVVLQATNTQGLGTRLCKIQAGKCYIESLPLVPKSKRSCHSQGEMSAVQLSIWSCTCPPEVGHIIGLGRLNISDTAWNIWSPTEIFGPPISNHWRWYIPRQV